MRPPQSYPELSESERYPTLTAAGRALLHRIREDAHAPRWRWPAGEQLSAADAEAVAAFDRSLAGDAPPFAPGGPPGWVAEFVERCLAEVPFYRRRSPRGTPFERVPTCDRGDLAPRVWEFVPDPAPIDRLICFSSSGTTGHPAKMPSHPVTVACGVPLMERLARPLGVSFPRGPQSMALVNVAAFPGAYTSGSVIAHLGEAGYTRVNLLPEDWRNPDADPRAFLANWPAPVYLGDPAALAELARIGLPHTPGALLSCTNTLTPGLAESLTRVFGCPVADVIALTEVGILAARLPGDTGHRLVAPDVYVEILDPDDNPVPPGERGEVTLTGGRNPFAPLLRYRTGDFASLGWANGYPTLVNFEGRPPVSFAVSGGERVSSMAVARALGRLPLVQYRVHQRADASVDAGFTGDADPDAVRAALEGVFGTAATLRVGPLPAGGDGVRKVVAFASEVGSFGAVE